MKAYTMGARALTESGNQFKEVFLEKMVKEGQITEEKKNEMNNYVVVVTERGFFGQLWDKILFKDPKDVEMKISVVKIIN